jgi:hypothetical protein
MNKVAYANCHSNEDIILGFGKLSKELEKGKERCDWQRSFLELKLS